MTRDENSSSNRYMFGVLNVKTTEVFLFFFFSSRRRHTRLQGDWSSDVCSSDLHDVVTESASKDENDGFLPAASSCKTMLSTSEHTDANRPLQGWTAMRCAMPSQRRSLCSPRSLPSWPSRGIDSLRFGPSWLRSTPTRESAYV